MRKATASASKNFRRGLNPYSIGRYSMSEMVRLNDTGDGVLILILLEDTL